ncbi:nucleoside triphosphate hydrolase [Acidithiobacillus marinus]|uniref:Nucleoside triphosphate hydrolase n=1 Tax=Acidithiobacillus marinus TaxID=187490 RepID=A0A2I1DKI3_9PROT|nr:NUDIX hydrolase [Acidithiobacillus marinus]PKY10374.1 nucleoside triphosphate hydrolase [Acidithiobacillus marinus]
MDRHALQTRLCQYRSHYIEEQAYARRGCHLLQDDPDCFFREGTGLHVTASTWILNPARSATLLMLHRKLEQWFQPGGHADGNENVIAVALKECSEETGITEADIHLLDPAIFDIDIHRTPQRGREPAHQHLDIRFLVEIDDRLPLAGNSESHALRWIPLHEVHAYNKGLSIHRMLIKSQEWLRQQRIQGLT